MTKITNTTIALAIIGTAIIVGGAGFFGGMKYQEGKRVTAFRQFGGMALHGGQNGMRQGFRPVSGEIIKTDATSITVKLPDGSSKIVLVGEKTTINKASEATRSNLVTGTTVAVFGTENADGTVTAQSVQLNPQLRFSGPGSSPSATPTP